VGRRGILGGLLGAHGMWASASLGVLVAPQLRIRQARLRPSQCRSALALARPIQRLAPLGRCFVASLLRKVIAVWTLPACSTLPRRWRHALPLADVRGLCGPDRGCAAARPGGARCPVRTCVPGIHARFAGRGGGDCAGCGRLCCLAQGRARQPCAAGLQRRCHGHAGANHHAALAQDGLCRRRLGATGQGPGPVGPGARGRGPEPGACRAGCEAGGGQHLLGPAAHDEPA